MVCDLPSQYNNINLHSSPGYLVSYCAKIINNTQSKAYPSPLTLTWHLSNQPRIFRDIITGTTTLTRVKFTVNVDNNKLA